MDKQSKSITTRLNQLAGVKEPEGRNGFSPLKDTLTFEKQRSKYVVFNYNKGDSVFDYDIIATFPTRKAAVSFIETNRKAVDMQEIKQLAGVVKTTKKNTFKSK